MATALESYIVFLYSAVERGMTQRELLSALSPLAEYGQGCENPELDDVLMHDPWFERLCNWHRSSLRQSPLKPHANVIELRNQIKMIKD